MIKKNNDGALAKDKIDISLISQPSDLFGKEILSECTFESQYGKLKFNAIVVPDLSKDKFELEIFTKQLDDIKTFIKEEDLLKKVKIIDSILKPATPVDVGRIQVVPNLKKSFLFLNILRSAIEFRLIENGKRLCCNICSYYGYEMHPKFHSIIMSWNDVPVIQPLACATGIYIQSLGKCLNPNAHGEFWYPELTSEILNNKLLPSHNYLSWSFHGALLDKPLIPFALEHKITFLLCD